MIGGDQGVTVDKQEELLLQQQRLPGAAAPIP